MAQRKDTKVSKEQLSQWYHDENKTTWDIANILSVGQSTVVYWMDKLGVSRRTKSEAHIKTWRADFSGDLEEKAHMLGFRLGDLYVYHVKPKAGKTIRVVCASSKMEQIRLIQSMFEPYGYVAVTKKIDGKTMISCYLNMSFDFLLPKQDEVEEWILSDEKCSLAFLAGYIDAEGSFKLDMSESGNLKIESYDVTILRRLHEILTRAGIDCPPPNMIKSKKTARQKLNQDVWRLGIYRKAYLDRLCLLLDPYLKHEQRRADMEVVWQNVRERIAR